MTDLVEAVARAVHEALSRAAILPYLDMPSDTATDVARAVIPVALERAAKVAEGHAHDTTGTKDAMASAIRIAAAIRGLGA